MKFCGACNKLGPLTSMNQTKEMFREGLGEKEKQSMIRKSEILVKAFTWDLGELGPFQNSAIYFLWVQK